MLTACKDNNPMLRDGLTGDWIGTFIGHKGAVWSVRLSDDATLAATGSADFSARVWDTFTGETTCVLEHNHIVRAVAFPPGERPGVLATGGMEKRLRIWDLARAGSSNHTNGNTNGVDAAAAAFYEVGAGEHQGAIKSIIWLQDPNIIVTAADDKKIRWYDLRRPANAIATYEIDGAPGSCELNICHSDPNTTTTTTTSTPEVADRDPDAGVISVAAGKNIYIFSASQPGHLLKHISTANPVASVAVNSASNRFVTGSPNDTWVHVWNLQDERELETGRGHHGPVWTTAFSPDGGLYATGSEDGTVKLWKAGVGEYGLWR